MCVLSGVGGGWGLVGGGGGGSGIKGDARVRSCLHTCVPACVCMPARVHDLRIFSLSIHRS